MSGKTSEFEFQSSYRLLVSPDSTTMVTQMYSMNSWSRQKYDSYASDGLPYVGYPGLTLTPIPESPLIDSPLTYSELDKFELEGDRDKWKPVAETHPLVNGDRHMHQSNLKKHKPQSGYGHREEMAVILEKGGETEPEQLNGHGNGLLAQPSKSCSVNVQVVQTTFLPKEEEMSPLQKRSHVCKLLLFALVGFAIVAGIVIWVFSPTFT